MEIVPGEFFVVHYKFPSGEKKFSEEEVRNGVMMEILDTSATINLPQSQKGGVTIKYKVL